MRRRTGPKKLSIWFQRSIQQLLRHNIVKLSQKISVGSNDSIDILNNRKLQDRRNLFRQRIRMATNIQDKLVINVPKVN